MTILKEGERAMVAAGLRLINKTWQMQTAPMKCGICSGDHVSVARDNAARRVYECDDCTAFRVITKGNGTAWWYHDWKKPEDANPEWFQKVFANA